MTRCKITEEQLTGLSSFKEITLLVVCYIVYLFTKDLLFDQSTALQNSLLILDIERRFGILVEPSIQTWLATNSPLLLTICNWLYIVTYWPVILGLSLLLYLRNRESYYRCRNIILVNLFMALIIFVLVPVSPPFRSVPNVIDSIQTLGPTFYGGPEMSVIYNTNAALPSLHFSWTLIFGIFFYSKVGGLLRVVVSVYPVLTLYVILVTGNHFIVDAVLGSILVSASFYIEMILRRFTYLVKSQRPLKNK